MTAAAHDTASVAIHSEVLGPLTIPGDQIVTFADGLYGFPQTRRFALLPTPRDGVFWLQSIEFSALVFLLVDPFPYFAHFHVELSDADKARLGTSTAEDVLVLAIVTLPPDQRGPCSANLHAPLLFNVRVGQGHQSIRADDGFGMREEFVL